MNDVPTHIAKLLEEKVRLYKNQQFILQDPVCIPHRFERKQDIEISGLLTAIISWGSRKNIIRSAQYLMMLMSHQPYNFVMNYSAADNKVLKKFYYRTFQPEDTVFFVKSLHRYYSKYNSLEKLFANISIIEGIACMREELLKTPHLKRSEKHLPDIHKGSAAKRINMFLRWMVRKDEVDFGIWNTLKPCNLLIPLDVHTARAAYELRLLNNTQSHLKNVLLLTEKLKLLDSKDPVKYDFALFGMSMYEMSQKSKTKL